ncbi:MAG: glycosyl hydrolase [Solirubrobacterales bacterium]
MKISLKAPFRRVLAITGLLAATCVIPASAQATIQLGAYTPGAPADARALSNFASMVGRQPEIVMWYRDFGLPLMYSNEVSNLRATGQAPMITWEPQDQSLSSIASGAYDSYLHESAGMAKSWGAPLMIRFGHEMNGTWYPWAATSTSSSDFIAAWRHIVSIFRADGASNVKWVWAPNVQEGSKYAIAPSFPGDEWIDYVGLDGYNWGNANGETWQTLESVFASSYATVTQLSTKPVMITETSSSESGGDKAAWIKSSFLTALPKLFPRISAVIWFDKTQEDDWRINSSQASLDAYRAVVDCSLYGGSGSCDAGTAPAPISTPGKKKKLKVRSVHVTKRVQSDVSGALSYALSETAQVKIKIIPAGRRANRAVVSRVSRPGRNRVPLERIVHRRKLQRGGYRVVITAKNDHGQRSRARKARFHVI